MSIAAVSWSPTSSMASLTHLALRLGLLLRSLGARSIPAIAGPEEDAGVKITWPIPGGEACVHLAALGLIECCVTGPEGTVSSYLAATIPEVTNWASAIAS